MSVELVSLGECCEFVSGSTAPAGEEYRNQPDGYLILKVSDLNLPANQYTVLNSNEWIANAPKGSVVCSENSIVLPKRGGAISTNKKRLLLRQAILDPNLMGVTPQLSILDPKYLYYWFQQFDLTSITSGSAVPQLNKQDLDPLRIPLPPLTEQKRIVSLLRRADCLRGLRRTAHDLGDALLQSVFLEMFGEYIYSGDFIELGDEIILGPSNGIYKSEEYFGSGTLLLDIKGLYKSFYADFNTARRIQTTDSELKKYQVADGDILINRVSKMPEGVGKTVLVRNSPEPFVYESNMMRFRVNSERLNGIYLVYFLASEFSRKDLISKSNISNQASINQETVRSLKISVPPLSLQEEFAGVVARVEGLRGRMSEAERQVEGLFEALLSESFG